jgi:hypothetical protein
LAKVSKQHLEAQLQKYNGDYRNGCIRFVVTLVVFVAITALKEYGVAQGSVIASSDIGNMVFYMIAIVAAGFAGFAARDAKRANDAAKAIEQKLNKKK